MISDSQLFKLSLSLSIIGIILLFFVVEYIIFPSNVKISEIDQSYLGKDVIVTGKVVSYTSKNKNYFITLEDDKEIKLVMFERDAKNTIINEIKENEKVMVKGEVNDYRGELEIIIKDIERV